MVWERGLLVQTLRTPLADDASRLLHCIGLPSTQSHKLPWQMLVSAKQAAGGADEATADKLSKEYAGWMQAAAVADAKAEIEGLQVC